MKETFSVNLNESYNIIILIVRPDLIALLLKNEFLGELLFVLSILIIIIILMLFGFSLLIEIWN